MKRLASGNYKQSLKFYVPNGYYKMKILITSPSLDTKTNVSGVSEITNFIIRSNTKHQYRHFRLGKSDNERRGFLRIINILLAWIKWFMLMISSSKILIHFNFALDKRSAYRDLPLIILAQLLGKKMIIHLHGGEYLQEKKPSKFLQMALSKVLSGKDPKIVLSPLEKEIVEEKFNAFQVLVLPNCIDLTAAGNFSRNGQAGSSPNLLFIGRVDKNKGIEYIYQALKMLKDKGVPFKFSMAGAGPEKDEYVQKFSASMNSHFEYKGVVSGKEKEDLFKESNIFLLPSMYEGLPISLIETMSFGIVPVVTNVGSISTLVKPMETGIFVNKQSAGDIAESIEKLLSNKTLMSRLSVNAREIVFRDFNPLSYIEKLNKIYELV
jgi:glycosyltransferase involved in cell wall biosynthesis